MSLPRILITGASGQLGQEFQALQNQYAGKYLFLSSSDLDIRDREAVLKMVDKFSPTHFINCAAYTAVDKAEEEKDLAYSINELALQHIVDACTPNETKVIHFSTDYVYDNDNKTPLKETDTLSPKSIYAHSKRLGEEVLRKSSSDYIILRTSWVYSSFGDNFLKTMMALSEKHEQLTIVDDQIGVPTFAHDIAVFVLDTIANSEILDWKKISGVYNFAPTGKTNWAAYAKYIFDQIGADTMIIPCSTESYGAPAPRPKWSVLDCSKLESTFGIILPHWKESVHKCVHLLNKKG